MRHHKLRFTVFLVPQNKHGNNFTLHYSTTAGNKVVTVAHLGVIQVNPTSKQSHLSM